TAPCEYKSAKLTIEFGLRKDGQVDSITVTKKSGWEIYDQYAVNAIRLASPFPARAAGTDGSCATGECGREDSRCVRVQGWTNFYNRIPYLARGRRHRGLRGAKAK